MGAIPAAPAAGEHLPSADIRTVAQGMQTIAGLRCQASGILKHGRPAAEVCMATAASGQLSGRDFATLEALVKLSRSVALELDGVPIAVRDIENNKRYQVTAVSNAALSDALFYGYDGFQKQAIPSLFR